jgi:hypothetical protein
MATAFDVGLPFLDTEVIDNNIMYKSKPFKAFVLEAVAH